MIKKIISIGEPERDIGAGLVNLDDRGVLVGVRIGTVPGGVGRDGGGGEGGERMEGAVRVE